MNAMNFYSELNIGNSVISKNGLHVDIGSWKSAVFSNKTLPEDDKFYYYEVDIETIKEGYNYPVSFWIDSVKWSTPNVTSQGYIQTKSLFRPHKYDTQPSGNTHLVPYGNYSIAVVINHQLNYYRYFLIIDNEIILTDFIYKFTNDEAFKTKRLVISRGNTGGGCTVLYNLGAQPFKYYKRISTKFFESDKVLPLDLENMHPDNFPYKPNKYLFRKDNKIYQPTSEGINLLSDTSLTREIFEQYGTEDITDIIGFNKIVVEEGNKIEEDVFEFVKIPQMKKYFKNLELREGVFIDG